jgi:hypothetical protein
VDNLTISGATVQIALNYISGEDWLEAVGSATIKTSFDTATGRLSLVGTDTLDHYQSALRSVIYRNTRDTPSPLKRTISVVVNDGSAESSSALREINFLPANDPPTISSIPDSATAEDAAFGPVPFTLGDAEGLIDRLSITSSSSNTKLVPNESIVFSGSGADRALFIVPASNQNGSSMITLTATDPDGGTTTRSFVLSVTPVNDPPVVANLEPTALEYTREGPKP